VNLNNYLCSTEQLYLAYKLSSLKFVTVDSGIATPPHERLIMAGPEGEVRLTYEPTSRGGAPYSFVIVVNMLIYLDRDFIAPFGSYKGRAVVKL
jgi:hypothetical protein